jgi:hypothetical protein
MLPPYCSKAVPKLLSCRCGKAIVIAELTLQSGGNSLEAIEVVMDKSKGGVSARKLVVKI